MEEPEKIMRHGIVEHLSAHFLQMITLIQLLRSQRPLDPGQINLVRPYTAFDFAHR